jgi:hypothetical protein
MGPFDVLGACRAAREDSGRSQWRQIIDMVGLRLATGKIRPEEYFYYRLYDPALTAAERRRFLGDWTRPLIYARNDPSAVATANDKLGCYAAFSAAGLPYPAVQAVYGGHAAWPDAQTLAGAGDISDFLSDGARYPLFIKPNTGSHGWASLLVAGLDKASGTARLGDGRHLAIEDIAAQVAQSDWSEVIFQDAILPHPDIARVTGGRLASLRVLVVRGADGPYCRRAVLRIPVGDKMTDNFDSGRTGNLVGPVNIDSGSVDGVFAGVGLARQRIDAHPDSAQPFAGWAVPQWQALCDVACRASALFPGLPLQSWDVAPSASGPQLIEINPRGIFRILQSAYGEGLGTDDVLRVAGVAG